MQASGGCRLCYQLAHGGQSFWCPVASPRFDALLLHFQRYKQLVGVGIVFYQTDALQRVELAVELGKAAEGLFHCAPLAGKVFRLVTAARSLVAEQPLRVTGNLGLVAEVVHVGVEMGAADDEGSYGHHTDNANGDKQSALAVEGIGAEAVEEGGERRLGGGRSCSSRLRLFTTAGQHLRQVGQREEGGAQDSETGKEAEVAQQVGIDKQQSGKRTDGGDAAHEHRLHLVAQQLVRIADVLMVGQHVQHVAHGHTKHDAADTQGQERELALYPVHHGQSEQRAEGYGQQQQRNDGPATETDDEEHQHQQQCAGNGGGQVVLDLSRVVKAAGRCAVVADAYLRVLLGKLGYQRVHPLEHGRALSRVGRRVAGRQESDAHRRVGHEEVAVGLVVLAVLPFAGQHDVG